MNTFKNALILSLIVTSVGLLYKIKGKMSMTASLYLKEGLSLNRNKFRLQKTKMRFIKLKKKSNLFKSK